jgi:hypothetical protein
MRTLITLGALPTALAVALGQVEPRGENPAIRVNTLLGPTGLITVPTSTTTRVERFQLGTAFGKDIRTVSVNWGIFDSIEIGGAVVDRNNQNNKVIATAKVTIIPQNFDWLELGFGAIDPFDAIDNTVYGMASVNVRVPALKRQSRSSACACISATAQASTATRLSAVARCFWAIGSRWLWNTTAWTPTLRCAMCMTMRCACNWARKRRSSTSARPTG